MMQHSNDVGNSLQFNTYYGYTCASCGAWVGNNSYHQCIWTNPVYPQPQALPIPYVITYPATTDYTEELKDIKKALKRVGDLLEKLLDNR